MTQKEQRQAVYNKFGGRCAYCGNQLPAKGWHVDEMLPVRRNHKWDKDRGVFVVDKDKPYEHPDRMCIENQMPACSSCNINKHSMDVEEFRKLIAGFMRHLNERSTQYKLAKRYGLVTETNIEVKFYYETLGYVPTYTDKFAQ